MRWRWSHGDGNGNGDGDGEGDGIEIVIDLGVEREIETNCIQLTPVLTVAETRVTSKCINIVKRRRPLSTL